MSPMLPLGSCVRTRRNDREARALADRHYSRKTPGHREFIGPGRAIILRDPAGTWLFVWRHCQYRLDGQTGWECSIFRNEGARLSSEIILECEGFVTGRLFTYVDASKVRSANPGYCFKRAGWRVAGRSKGRGLVLLVKEAASHA
ncbi:MAG: hypothetical protein RDU24_08930 [Humidesulfovibrio sp.]|uniref:hypothetical protein n=1 Tax=Humidesulfovibrio sp. TaxID=2910988 RepID=UPI0027F417FD|nr:hypothetical protein [Humidesulfovibrio sp.]MDQ7835492.1 hypothetical protein [Humidesulfovibrio sp.]